MVLEEGSNLEKWFKGKKECKFPTKQYIKEKENKENNIKVPPRKGQNILPHCKPRQCPCALCDTCSKCPRMICKHAHHFGTASVKEKTY